MPVGKRDSPRFTLYTPQSKRSPHEKTEFFMMNIMTAIFVRERKNYFIERLRKKAIVSISPIPFIVRNLRFYLSALKVKTIRT